MRKNIKYIDVRNKRKKMKISIGKMSELIKENFDKSIAPTTYYKKEVGEIPTTTEEANMFCTILNLKPSVFFKEKLPYQESCD